MAAPVYPAIASGDSGSSQQSLWRRRLDRFDEFDLCQLAKVVEVCKSSKNRAEAGKKLFAVSRRQRNTTNDSDRLGKYLEKFGLTFQMCKDI